MTTAGESIQMVKSQAGALPLNYREHQVSNVMRTIRAGDSCSIVAVSGMGKSNLFRHLLDREVRQHYLGQEWTRYLFVPADCNRAADETEHGLFSLILGELVTQARESNVEDTIVGIVESLRWRALGPGNPALMHECFVESVKKVACDPELHLVFLFDQFDKVYQSIAPRNFSTLRAIRDEFKYRISYLVFTREELPRLCQAAECSEFYELVQSQVIGLGPYNHEESWIQLKRIATRYGESPEVGTGDRLISLAGGHAGILRAAYMSTLQPDMVLPAEEKDATAVLLANQDVMTECTKLWESLGADERDALRTLAQGSALSQNKAAERRLRLKGIMTKEGQVFSPLFAEYVAELLAPNAVETKVQAGTIRIDTASEVWIKGKRIEPPLTASELQLLTYLVTKAGQICTKDEISAVLQPNKLARGEVMSDAALGATVKRLRDRIEDDPDNPTYVHTVRGKGYMLQSR